MTGKVETSGTIEPTERKVCSGCVGDEYLKKVVNRCGEAGKCIYCGNTTRTIELKYLAKHMKRFFDDHFILDADDPYSNPKLPFMKDLDGNVEEIIQEYADVEKKLSHDLRSELWSMHYNLHKTNASSDNPFDEYAFYNNREIDSKYWDSLWSELKKTIIEENRLFNNRAKEILDLVFGSTVIIGSKEISTIIEVGPGMPIKRLFRAREFQSEREFYTALCYPDRELGPPPSSLATAGRMNSKGVAMFYGATSSKVAVAEIRPTVGSRVIVARFDILRNLKLLDIAKLESLFSQESLFRPSQKRILEKIKFISSLCDRISAPVMPQDESADYLVTQAISDYLSQLTYPTPIDGLIYHSAQVGSEMKNVVLFYKSSRVELRRNPKEAKAFKEHEESHYSNYKVEYHVHETRRCETERHPEGVSDSEGNKCYSNERRAPSLKLDPSKISVHFIEGVKFNTQRQKVRRFKSGEEKLFDHLYVIRKGEIPEI